MNIRHPYIRPTIVLRRILNEAGIRKEKKVFVIGFNKSASTSLHHLFESLNLPSYHGVKWRKHDDPRFLKKYDCFSDGIPRDLPTLDRLFPSSRFILNVRDLGSWVYSRLAHIERAKNAGNFQGGRTWDNTEEAIKAWIRQRNDYHLFVLSYFSGRSNDILVVNFIRDKLAATKVCRFIGHKGEYQRPMANVNPINDRPQKHSEMLEHCIEELGIPEHELDYDIYCPALESKETQSIFPWDSSLL
jgi:hypothetical protein